MLGGKVGCCVEARKEQEIWRRVRGGAAPGAAEALLPERLEALILEQRADAAAMRALAGRMRGPASGRLRSGAAALEHRARELRGLHYLLTGRRLRPQSPPLRLPEPPAEALRQLCLRQREAARSFGALGEEFRDFAGDFDAWAGQAREQAGALLRLLRNQAL